MNVMNEKIDKLGKKAQKESAGGVIRPALNAAKLIYSC